MRPLSSSTRARAASPSRARPPSIAGTRAPPGRSGVLRRRHRRRARQAVCGCGSRVRRRQLVLSRREQGRPQSYGARDPRRCPCCSARTTSASRKPSTTCSPPTRARSCATRSSCATRIVALVADRDARRALGRTRAARRACRSRRDGTQLRSAARASLHAALSPCQAPTARPQNAAVLSATWTLHDRLHEHEETRLRRRHRLRLRSAIPDRRVRASSRRSR